MDKISNILDNLKLNSVRLTNLKTSVNSSNDRELETEWFYEIIKKEEDKLVILASAETRVRLLFDIEATFLITFDIAKEITYKEIEDSIDNLVYVASAKYSLLSSFVSDMMYDIPIPIAPYVNEEKIRKKIKHKILF